MSNLRELGLEEATLKALADTVTDRLKAVRAQTQTGLDDAEEQSGTRQVVAKLPNGTTIATLSLTEPKPEAKITDAEAFQAWVMETFPDEIQRRFVAEVRAAFAEKLLGQMTAAGVARLLNTETGELHDVPGVEVKATRSQSAIQARGPGGHRCGVAGGGAGPARRTRPGGRRVRRGRHRQAARPDRRAGGARRLVVRAGGCGRRQLAGHRRCARDAQRGCRVKLTARHLFRGRGLHRPRRVEETVPLDELFRPEEAMANDEAWCAVEQRYRLHAYFQMGGRICWTCRTVTPCPPPPVSMAGGAE